MRTHRAKCDDCGRTVTLKSLRDGTATEDECPSLSLTGTYDPGYRTYCANCTAKYNAAYPPVRERETSTP